MSQVEPESVFFIGRHFAVFFARDAAGSEPARQFLELERGGRHRKSCDKIAVTVSLFADTPPGGFRNADRFKPVEGEVYEFRDDQIRVLCAFDGKGRVLLLHGVVKKKDDLRRQDIERAVSVLSDHRIRRNKK